MVNFEFNLFNFEVTNMFNTIVSFIKNIINSFRVTIKTPEDKRNELIRAIEQYSKELEPGEMKIIPLVPEFAVVKKGA